MVFIRKGHVFHEDDAARIFHRICGDFAAGKEGELPLRFRGDPLREGGAVGEQDGAGEPVVLGLREDIRRDVGGVLLPVRYDEDLGGAGEHVDADLAVHLFFGEGDVDVAGAGDDVDLRDALRAAGERGDRLRAARP